MIKSARARSRRKERKQIVAGLKKRFYRDLHHLREKYKKIKNRHHDE
jgi:hypothetical protein